MNATMLFSVFALATLGDLPPADKVKIVKLFEVPNYCEGIVFDHEGFGYISHGKVITKFSPDGKNAVWAETGAPNGHKVLADGTHLVCDASQHAVLHLDKDGQILQKASAECDGKPLRGPNDLTLDPKGGFYFTDPGGSDDKKLIGTIHHVDTKGKTHLIAEGLAFPNGIVLTPDGKRLLVAESKKNRILEYPVTAPGKIGAMKVFCELPEKKGEQIDNQPDGICLDTEGNLYVAHYGMRQVQVLNPEGKVIRRYPGGNLTTSNVGFSGPKMNQLFITGGLGAEAGGGGLFRIELEGVRGLVILPPKGGMAPLEFNNRLAGITKGLQAIGMEFGGALASKKPATMEAAHKKLVKEFEKLKLEFEGIRIPDVEGAKEFHSAFVELMRNQEKMIRKEFLELVQILSEETPKLERAREILTRVQTSEQAVLSKLKAAQQRFAEAAKITIK